MGALMAGIGVLERRPTFEPPCLGWRWMAILSSSRPGCFSGLALGNTACGSAEKEEARGCAHKRRIPLGAGCNNSVAVLAPFLDDLMLGTGLSFDPLMMTCAAAAQLDIWSATESASRLSYAFAGRCASRHPLFSMDW